MSKKVKICRRRRTCADGGNTDREILRQIVCEALCAECAVCRKILSKGDSKEGKRKRQAQPCASVAPFEHVEFLDMQRENYSLEP